MLSLSAFLSKVDKPSAQIKKRYGDSGSPCRSPLSGRMNPFCSPFNIIGSNLCLENTKSIFQIYFKWETFSKITLKYALFFKNGPIVLVSTILKLLILFLDNKSAFYCQLLKQTQKNKNKNLELSARQSLVRWNERHSDHRTQIDSNIFQLWHWYVHSLSFYSTILHFLFSFRLLREL